MPNLHLLSAPPSHYPEVMVALTGQIAHLPSCDDLFHKLLALYGKSTSEAKQPWHVNLRPAHTSLPPTSRQCQPKFMTVHGPVEVMQNREFHSYADDWQDVMSIRSNLKLFRYKSDSPEAVAAQEKWGHICYNCKSTAHFLRNCDRPYLNDVGCSLTGLGKGQTRR